MKRLLPALLTAAALAVGACNTQADPAGPKSPTPAPVAPGNPDRARPISPSPGAFDPGSYGPGPTDQPGLIRPGAMARNPYVHLAADTRRAPLPGPTIPANARYTLLCRSFTGQNHVAVASAVKDQLRTATNLPGWYVVHQPERSELYYGYYAAIDDPRNPAETRRADADKQSVQTLDDGAGGKPFGKALFVALDSPDPSAPPQWNLVNARGDYTLEIASYTGPGRKEAAVESVQQAREQGVEAYYYHGDAVSSVCIGVFPAAAVRGAVNDGNPDAVAYGGINRPGPEDAASLDPNESIVVSPIPLPKNLRTPRTPAAGTSRSSSRTSNTPPTCWRSSGSTPSTSSTARPRA